MVFGDVFAASSFPYLRKLSAEFSSNGMQLMENLYGEGCSLQGCLTAGALAAKAQL